MAADSVRSEIEGGVALATMDDGKANAISLDVIAALNAHLDRAEKEASAVLLTGRPGTLSGGFDLSVMRGGPEGVARLVIAGAELFLRILEFPLPVVVAASGHAVAAGALILLAGDSRVGAAGEFKIGLNEVGVGMTLPVFAAELARNRLSKRHFHRATLEAKLYAPTEAVDAGYLDFVVEAGSLADAGRAEAERLAALQQPAFRGTKQRLNSALVANVRATLEADMKLLTSPPS